MATTFFFRQDNASVEVKTHTSAQTRDCLERVMSALGQPGFRFKRIESDYSECDKELRSKMASLNFIAPIIA